MFKDYFYLSFKSLRKRGLRSWLTILGIFIGIAAVVSLISLGAGLRTAVTGQFGALSFDTLTIQNKGVGFAPPGSTVVEKLNDEDIRLIENVNGIDITLPRLLRVLEFEFNGVSSFGYVVDLPSEREKLNFVYESGSLEAQAGQLLEPGETGKVLLGSDFAGENRFGREIRVGDSIRLNDQEFEVASILEPTSSFQVNGVVLMSNRDMTDLLDIENEYDLIVVRVENPNNIENVAEEIERKLRNDRDKDLGEESFTVQTPLQALEAVNTILNIINIIVIGIAAISLFVGGIGIANTMYTSVLERTREIGIMKAVGARNSDITWLFLIESGLLGLVGGIVGALIGLGAAFGVSAIANQAIGEDLFVIAISYPLLLGSVAFSFLIGVVSGVLPAFQASKLNVVDALRK